MKKLFTVSLVTLGLVVSSVAQSWISTTVTLPSSIAASTYTNLWNGPTRLLSFEVVRQGTGNVASAFRVFDSPLIQYEAGNNLKSNIFYFTNAPYVTYTVGRSNMNYLASGSRVITGVNWFPYYSGATPRTITNSSVLSNYFFTVSNVSVGGYVFNRTVLTGNAPTNTTTTFDFSSAGGLWFGKGIGYSNIIGGASDGDTIVLLHDPMP